MKKIDIAHDFCFLFFNKVWNWTLDHTLSLKMECQFGHDSFMDKKLLRTHLFISDIFDPLE